MIKEIINRITGIYRLGISVFDGIAITYRTYVDNRRIRGVVGDEVNFPIKDTRTVERGQHLDADLLD